jgi:hypothetical protein
MTNTTDSGLPGRSVFTDSLVALAGEVGKVEAQEREERRPALFHAVECLVFPLGADRRMRAAHHATTQVPPALASTRNSVASG